jgi:hypothetical protein
MLIFRMPIFNHSRSAGLFGGCFSISVDQHQTPSGVRWFPSHFLIAVAYGQRWVDNFMQKYNLVQKYTLMNYRVENLHTDRIDRRVGERSDLWMVYTPIRFVNDWITDPIYERFTHRSDLWMIYTPIRYMNGLHTDGIYNGLHTDPIYERFTHRSDLWMIHTPIRFMNDLHTDRI